MRIDENTKIIGRFHHKVSPRGLNIYNPYFEEEGINALYVLFWDPDPKRLFEGLRKLKLAGAVTVGFENDPQLFGLLDEYDDMVGYTKKVGFVTNVDGKVKGFRQGGEAFFKTIERAQSIKGKRLVLVGAGNIAQQLLFYLQCSGNVPRAVDIYNRTQGRAEALQKEFKCVTGAYSLDKLTSAGGDILANVSHLGGSVPDNVFTRNLVEQFGAVADITFETESTNLIALGKKLKKRCATGWDMFTYQGQIVLETILGQPISFEKLQNHVRQGLGETVK
jgi:shikimate 5-dehydrogenase